MQSRMLSFLRERSAFSTVLIFCLFALLTASRSQIVLARALDTSMQAGSTQTRPTVALSDNAVAIDVGWRHACAVTRAGGVKCWGANSSGQLGDGTNTFSNAPVDVVGLTGATAVEAGYFYTCAVTTGGVKCWGGNNQGQLGNGSTTPSQTPVMVTGLSGGVRAISANDMHTCVLTNEGGVKCWGDNSRGQLGNSTNNPSSVPVDVTGLTSGVTAVAAGESHSCAILATGTVKCWGLNNNGQLGDNSNTNRTAPVDVSGLSGAVSLAAGAIHTCAILSNGGVKCWGFPYGKVPVDVSGITGARAIAAGEDYSCALVGGAAKCWGDNELGELGNGTTDHSATPVSVSGLTGAVAISAAYRHTCALTAAGTVECWGSNEDGRLGIGEWPYQTSPVEASGLTITTAMGAGENHTCAVIAGAVQCWGSNQYGQLGNNSTVYSNVPVDVSGISGASFVAAGGRHTCALVSGGVKCWGENQYGQLGNNSYTYSLVPLDVGLTGVAAIVSGYEHTCALITPGGTVKCWGKNTNGQLGNGSNTDSAVPVNVTGVSGATAIAAGNSHTCALVGGTVQCWGYNAEGQLGDGSTTNRNQPVTVSGLTGATHVIAGGWHTCASTASGAECWGYNSDGQLGDGTNTPSSTPVAVSGLSGNLTDGSAGDQHTCVVVSSIGGSTAKCWGSNAFGQLGNGSTTSSNTPVTVNGMPFGVGTSIVNLAAGGDHTCVQTNYLLLSSIRVKCWGSTLYGQLGNGAFGLRSTPTSVLGFVAAYFDFLPATLR